MGLPTSSSNASLTGDENNRGSLNDVGAGIPDEKPVVAVVALAGGPPLEWIMVEGDEKVFIFVG